MSELTDYYKNLLIVQYHQKPKAQATVAALVDSILSDDLVFDVRDGFNIDTAVGTQLDIIGLYVGIDRFYAGQDLPGFFSLLLYSETTSIPADRIGFAVYADVDTKTGKTLKYSDVLSGTLMLPDDAYRFLLKLKIVQNNSDHSHKSIDDSIYRFFGNTLYADSSGDMVMYYFADAGQGPILEAAIQKGVLPRPMGVRLNYIIEQTAPFFGFATYSDTSGALIEGFATYADYDTKVGETLTYDKLREAA